jgi:predicted ATP-grasp superfamily ATP-dependent carboligase
MSEGLLPARTKGHGPMAACLVLGAHVTGLGVIRSLGEKGVPVIALTYLPSDIGHLSRHVERCVRVPHPEKATSEFLDFMLAARDLHGGVLVPTEDAALAVVSRHREGLAACYRVAVPEWEVTRQVIEKRWTYRLADELGIPSPRTLVPASAREAREQAEAIGYPCLVKPSVSHRFVEVFGTKMVEVHDGKEMLDVCREAWASDLEVMIQEMIPGADSEGANYNSYFSEGEPIAEFTAAKVRLAPSRFGRPRVVVSRHIPEVIESGRAILRALGFGGFSCTEFKRDERDGVYKLMEVNGRHNLSSRLAVKCGVNFPWLMYQHLRLGRAAPEPAPRQGVSWREGVYWIDEFRDPLFCGRYAHRERYPIGSYLKPYFSRHVFATFAPDDPLPFAARLLGLAMSCFRKGGRQRDLSKETVVTHEG